MDAFLPLFTLTDLHNDDKWISLELLHHLLNIVSFHDDDLLMISVTIPDMLTVQLW